MYPIVPILAGFASLFGLTTLVWYYDLSREERARADRLTAEYARSLFDKAVDDLTRSEAKSIHDRVKAHFIN
jgi:hypothetical protein